MVNFLNIIIDGEYIYALAEDTDNDVRVKVKVHRTREEYNTEDGRIYPHIQQAVWCLQDLLERNKKLNQNETIAWY